MTIAAAEADPSGGKAMRPKNFSTLICVVLCVHAACVAALGQTIKVRKVVDRWVTVTGTAAGVDEKAKEQAVAHALPHLPGDAGPKEPQLGPMPGLRRAV